MALQLFAHPFSSYSQKALIAFYENDIPFQFRLLSPEQEANGAEFAGRWPIGKFPLLVDGERTLPEASIIIEHLQNHYPGPIRLIPEHPDLALEVRLLDRFFDNYVSTPIQRVVGDSLRPEGDRDPHGVDEARRMLETAYGWLENHLQRRTWAVGDGFSLADCGAAPFLFYADWTHPIGEAFPRVRAYRRRLLERPSFARCVEEARPYRSFFPLGAPDRD